MTILDVLNQELKRLDDLILETRDPMTRVNATTDRRKILEVLIKMAMP